ncbi:MAG: class I SAM-dependent methyltransferase [Cyanobacteria bacterium P01_F01_bin.150]
MPESKSRINYYDRIASIYDQTRWITDSVAEEIADFILELVRATASTSFLEPAVGTGLNMMPFVKRGYAVTGIDISAEMLDQFRQKIKGTSGQAMPENLTLIQGDASQLPFPDNHFDVILTVHMIHAVTHWQRFLDDIERVLKPQGVYINAQWLLPPARRKFQDHFYTILANYPEAYTPYPADKLVDAIAIDDYFRSKGYHSDYRLVKKWPVGNTVQEMLAFYRARAYGFCWRVENNVFPKIMNELESFCIEHYGSLDAELSSNATFELWAYTANSCKQ